MLTSIKTWCTQRSTLIDVLRTVYTCVASTLTQTLIAARYINTGGAIATPVRTNLAFVDVLLAVLSLVAGAITQTDVRPLVQNALKSPPTLTALTSFVVPQTLHQDIDAATQARVDALSSV